MSDDETFDTPEDDEVYQSDDPGKAVLVEIGNVVRSAEMPTRSGGFFSRSAPTTGNRILPRDERRKSATLVCDQDMYIAGTIGEVQNGSGACRWPANTPLVITFSDEVFAAGVSAEGTVNVIAENWAF